jgi:hypothetical protein
MMHDLTLPALAVAVLVMGVSAVYLWSRVPSRRRRAWRLLKLLLTGR